MCIEIIMYIGLVIFPIISLIIFMNVVILDLDNEPKITISNEGVFSVKASELLKSEKVKKILKQLKNIKI